MSNPYTAQQERLQPDDAREWTSHEAALINDALDRKRAEFVSGAMSGDRAKAETAAELLIERDEAKALLVDILMTMQPDWDKYKLSCYTRIRNEISERLTNLAADRWDECDAISDLIEAGELDEAT